MTARAHKAPTEHLPLDTLQQAGDSHCLHAPGDNTTARIKTLLRAQLLECGELAPQLALLHYILVFRLHIALQPSERNPALCLHGQLLQVPAGLLDHCVTGW
jgi:hypothetical protein